MSVGTHIRRTFLAGLFSAIPIVVTVVAVYYVEKYTQMIAPKVMGVQVPLLGVVIAVAGVYLLGVVVSMAFVKWALSWVDRVLERMPGVSFAYRAWKQVSLNQGPGGAGMWDKVALVSVAGNGAWEVGFTSGVENGVGMMCVFVPSAPAPTAGRLYLVPAERVRVLAISVEEGFKYLISGGNYVPAEMVGSAVPVRSASAERVPVPGAGVV